MADITVECECEEGYTVSSVIDDEWELVVDALGEDGPSANQTLAAAYASCYVPAFRVGADQTGYDDVGRIEVTVHANLDDDDDLTDIAFDIRVEEDLGDDVDEIVAKGEDICHVHSALREGLLADISVEDDAF